MIHLNLYDMRHFLDIAAFNTNVPMSYGISFLYKYPLNIHFEMDNPKTWRMELTNGGNRVRCLDTAASSTSYKDTCGISYSEVAYTYLLLALEGVKKLHSAAVASLADDSLRGLAVAVALGAALSDGLLLGFAVVVVFGTEIHLLLTRQTKHCS